VLLHGLSRATAFPDPAANEGTETNVRETATFRYQRARKCTFDLIRRSASIGFPALSLSSSTWSLENRQIREERDRSISPDIAYSSRTPLVFWRYARSRELRGLTFSLGILEPACNLMALLAREIIARSFHSPTSATRLLIAHGGNPFFAIPPCGGVEAVRARLKRRSVTGYRFHRGFLRLIAASACI